MKGNKVICPLCHIENDFQDEHDNCCGSQCFGIMESEETFKKREIEETLKKE